MLKINLAKRVIKFLTKLPPKVAKQITKKLMALREDPFPQDTKKLLNSIYSRVDSGEYRIIYRLENKLLYVVLVGKQNDDEVYRQLKKCTHETA